MTNTSQPTAVITGASKGLGRALGRALVDRGWLVIGNARHVAAEASGVTFLRGDVADPEHRGQRLRQSQGCRE